jgi:pimeloyl-ACP methyl ester carboxylesterase
MATVNIDGFELFYDVKGEGPTLVFAHGIGGNHSNWYQQVSYFSQWYRVVTFDHRGFGNSRDRADGPGRAAFADDMKALVDHLEVDQVVLVAQSMGGSTCGLFTQRNPERVQALVLGDTLGGMALPAELEGRMDEVRVSTSSMSQLDRVLSNGFRQREPGKTELYTQLNSFNMVNRGNLPGAFPQGPTPEEIAGMGIPLLFVVGLEDVLFPPDVIRGLHRRIPGSTLVEVPYSGHSTHYEQPEIFNQAVHQFLLAQGIGAAPQESLQPALAS